MLDHAQVGATHPIRSGGQCWGYLDSALAEGAMAFLSPGANHVNKGGTGGQYVVLCNKWWMLFLRCLLACR
jgi:hypothetical protein